MILQEGKKKNSYIIEGLFLPLQTEKRLEALGMTKGTPVEVLNRKRSGTKFVFDAAAFRAWKAGCVSVKYDGYCGKAWNGN